VPTELAVVVTALVELPTFGVVTPGTLTVGVGGGAGNGGFRVVVLGSVTGGGGGGEGGGGRGGGLTGNVGTVTVVGGGGIGTVTVGKPFVFGGAPRA
jgi:hypothetical protein